MISPTPGMSRSTWKSYERKVLKFTLVSSYKGKMRDRLGYLFSLDKEEDKISRRGAYWTSRLIWQRKNSSEFSGRHLESMTSDNYMTSYYTWWHYISYRLSKSSVFGTSLHVEWLDFNWETAQKNWLQERKLFSYYDNNIQSTRERSDITARFNYVWS